jgi:photosystem II stability/assembly factor-like uncharacterized protein
MKKILVQISFILSAFLLISLGGCPIVQLPPDFVIEGSQSSHTIYPPFDSRGEDADTLYYSIYVGADGKINRSTGKRNIVLQEVISGTNEKLNAVRMPNNYYQNILAVVGNNGTVLVSSNTGLTWMKKNSVTAKNLKGVDHNYFLFAVGDEGTILYANEIITGNLVMRNSGTNRNLTGVSMSRLNNQHLIVVGDKGTILRSTDTGFNWANVSIPDTSFDFNAISQQGVYYTGDIFVAVGSGGRIYKTTDVGDTWQQKISGTTSNLRSVSFVSQDSGVVVGDNGTILFTTNGGDTWFTDAAFISPTTRDFKSVSCIDKETNTYSAISDSLFFVSTEQIIVEVKETKILHVEGYSLNQNYPNPFNPTTTIRYQLPVAGNVTLKVYDILGHEVVTLVDAYKPTGSYEINFQSTINNKQLTSGVYFYHLRAGSFAETKKMILLR